MSETVETEAARIAREVMSDSFGLPVDEYSADSNGALMIREGIRRYAALQSSRPVASEGEATSADRVEAVARAICCARARCDGCKGSGEGGCFDLALWDAEAKSAIEAVITLQHKEATPPSAAQSPSDNPSHKPA